MTRRSMLFLAAAGMIPNPVQWIDVDLRTGSTGRHWPDMKMPIDTGSLLKPFLSLAYKATYRSFPTMTCLGVHSGCWYAAGHGAQDFRHALANSCNAYFLTLMKSLDRAALDAVCLSYGLVTPSRSLTDAQLIGLGGGWRQTPNAIVEAFTNLTHNRSDPAVELVLSGMALCARKGTAKDVGFSCYAKTGTAPCCHAPRASGDGYAVAFYPEDEPRRLLFAQHHNTTGANTARDVRALSLRV